MYLLKTIIHTVANLIAGTYPGPFPVAPVHRL